MAAGRLRTMFGVMTRHTVVVAVVMSALLGLIAVFPALASAGAVSGVSVSNGSPSSAAGARTVYRILFTTSSTGALSGSAGSRIAISFPAGTNLSFLNGSSVIDNGQQVGSCGDSAGTSADCEVTGTVAADDTVTVELDGVLNPAAINETTLNVSTTSDTTTAISSGYAVTTAGQTTAPIVSMDSSAAGAPTVYRIAFTTSLSGGLSNVVGSQIAITLPAGTGLSGVGGSVFDNGRQVGSCGDSVGTTATCQISGAVAGGEELTVELDGLTNPSSVGAERVLKLTTSSDTLTATSGDYAITTPQEPEQPRVGNYWPSSAAGARTVYRITFATSSSGALSGSAGSQITIDFPPGTGVGGTTGTVTDNNGEVGLCSGSGISATCQITERVADEEELTVELDGVVNPGATAGTTLSVSTTSDRAAVDSNSYSVAPASQASAPTVSLSSTAAGALAVYRIAFKESSTGGLSNAAYSQIEIALPSGTGLSGVTGSVSDNGRQVGPCGEGEGTTAICRISSTVAGDEELSVELDGVINPEATNGTTLSVTTSSDTLTATSGSYAVTPPQEPEQAMVSNGSPSSAAGARTVYRIAFATSSSGALSSSADSQITIDFPRETGLNGVTGTVIDSRNAGDVGSCSGAGTIATCQILGSVAADEEVVVELYGVTNPGSTNGTTVSVATTSDTTAARSGSYAVDPAGHTTQPVVNATVSAVGALAVYRIALSTSATGGLSPAAGSQITIDFPRETGLGGVSGSVSDGGQQVGYCSGFAGALATCQISSTVAPGDELAIELNGVTNPPTAGNRTLKVTTSSDTLMETSASYAITTPNEPQQLTVSDGSPSSAAGARTVYRITFTTSPSGALSSAAGSQVTILVPPGTGLESVSGSVADDTSGQQVGYCSGSGRTATCQISGAVAVGEEVTVELNGVTNPGAAGAQTLKLSTTSDTATATSASYAITAPHEPGQPAVVNSSPSSAPGALTVYAITFTTSPTGALAGRAGSQITVALPQGTGLGSASGTVNDNTSGQQVGYCSVLGTTATCPVNGTVAAGDSVSVDLDGVMNPVVPAPQTLRVWSTSDTIAATSAAYGVGAPVVVTGSAANISEDTAFVTGTVNPEDTAVTDCHFEWGPTAGYGQSAACSQVVGSGGSAESVTAALTGLAANTTYHFRVVATNAGGTSYGGDAVLATAASQLSTSAPAVLPAAPAVVSAEGAAFSGTVDPAGLATTAHFEYGLDPRYSGGGPVSYDQATPTQTVGSDFTGHVVAASVSGLVPNALYHVRLVAANGAGTTVGADQTFTTRPGAAPSAPTVGQTVDLQPVGGLVLVKLAAGRSGGAVAASSARGWISSARGPISSARAAAAPPVGGGFTKGEGFIPLTEPRQIPVGSELDTRQGTVNLIVAAGQRRHTHTAKLSGGLFAVSQERSGLHKGLATFTLKEGLFPGAPSFASCGGVARASLGLDAGAEAGDAGGARIARASKQVLQTLHAQDSNGSFRTSGRYSAATVRGTIWETSDRCDGTLTSVRRGAVDVFDFASRKTVALHAGQSYLAPA